MVQRSWRLHLEPWKLEIFVGPSRTANGLSLLVNRVRSQVSVNIDSTKLIETNFTCRSTCFLNYNAYRKWTHHTKLSCTVYKWIRCQLYGANFRKLDLISFFMCEKPILFHNLQKVHDGTSTKSPKIMEICSNKHPPTIISEGNSLTIALSIEFDFSFTFDLKAFYTVIDNGKVLTIYISIATFSFIFLRLFSSHRMWRCIHFYFWSNRWVKSTVTLTTASALDLKF